MEEMILNNTGSTSRNVENLKTSTHSHDSIIPDWYRKHMKPMMDFSQRLNPNPFNQPSDISDYIALHQNDNLRLGNHPSVV